MFFDRISIIRKFLALLSLLCLLVWTEETPVYAYDSVVIVIDPGHGGVVTEDNTNGGCIYNNLIEKEVNLATAQALYDELTTYQNVTVYMTRTSDVEMSIPDRIAFAQSVNADILISVHYNASNDHNFFGSEIFTSMYSEFYATGNGLGQCIQKKWTEYGTAPKGIKTREGKNGDYYGLIRQGKEAGIPTIILEHGYLDNDKDFKRIGNPGAWSELGRMDAAGIAEYYGLRKDTVLETVTPTVKVATPKNPHKPDTTSPENVKLVITDYDRDSGEVKYSISASETDSSLMYYGFETGTVTNDTIFDDLMLWDNSKGIQTGTYMAPLGYEGKLTARVYNTYELFSDSETIDMSTFDAAGTDAAQAASGMSGETGETGGKNGKESANPVDGSADGQDTEVSDGEASSDKSGDIQIIDEIIVGDKKNDEYKHIDITSKMVDDAINPRMETNKAMLGLIITISVVILTGVVTVVIVVSSAYGKNKKRRR